MRPGAARRGASSRSPPVPSAPCGRGRSPSSRLGPRWAAAAAGPAPWRRSGGAAPWTPCRCRPRCERAWRSWSWSCRKVRAGPGGGSAPRAGPGRGASATARGGAGGLRGRGLAALRRLTPRCGSRRAPVRTRPGGVGPGGFVPQRVHTASPERLLSTRAEMCSAGLRSEGSQVSS